MDFSHRGSHLAFGLALVLLQIGTTHWCFASEVVKSGEHLDPQAFEPTRGFLPSALLSLNAETDSFSRFALVVDKKTRTLTVWESDGDKVRAVESFPTDIGSQRGDKTKEGDLKTPEGIYFFQSEMDGNKVGFSQYGERIFTMDYPNYFDRLEKKTGKGIWLHAIPDTKSLQRGSHGCVVVRNRAIEGLAKYIELKRTPIVVVDQVEYLPERKWRFEQKKIKDWLGSGFKDVQIFKQGSKLIVRYLDGEAKILYALKGDDGIKIVGEQRTAL